LERGEERVELGQLHVVERFEILECRSHRGKFLLKLKLLSRPVAAIDPLPSRPQDRLGFALQHLDRAVLLGEYGKCLGCSFSPIKFNE
jgi:hypothetical protein